MAHRSVASRLILSRVQDRPKVSTTGPAYADTMTIRFPLVSRLLSLGADARSASRTGLLVRYATTGRHPSLIEADDTSGGKINRMLFLS